MNLGRLGCGGSAILGLAMLGIGAGAKGVVKKAEFASEMAASDTFVRRAAEFVEVLDSRTAVERCFGQHRVCLEDAELDLSLPLGKKGQAALEDCRHDVESCLRESGGGR